MFQPKKKKYVFYSFFHRIRKGKTEAFHNNKKIREHREQTHFHCGCFYAQPPKTLDQKYKKQDYRPQSQHTTFLLMLLVLFPLFSSHN